MSYVPVIYDLLLFKVFLPLILYPNGRVISYYNDHNQNSISICLIYNICTQLDLRRLGPYTLGFQSLLVDEPSHNGHSLWSSELT
jgi:hypothetical protein